MKIVIHTLTSPIHDIEATDRLTAAFVGQLQQALEQQAPEVELQLQGEDFAHYGEEGVSLIFVRTGGTEGIFRQLLQTHTALQDTHSPILLLASGSSNSLAASMEILSFLNKQGRRGEIIHGTADYMTRRIIMLARTEEACKQLRGQRIGVIGKPSDWLIASDIDTEALQRKAGIGIIDINIEELLAEIALQDYPAEVHSRIRQPQNGETHLPIEGALHIYGALRRLCERYALNALTVRCFDLLDTVHNTGCLALALLNSEGIPASCEGDIPALLSMMVSQALTGTAGFQANPSRINPERGELLFAHCTAPLCMLTGYTYDTHFESGIGVALRGSLPEGPVTLFKTDGAFDRYIAANATLLRNGHENNLCRTQVTLHAPETIGYFLQQPIGNHHIIVPGHKQAIFDLFMQRLNRTT